MHSNNDSPSLSIEKKEYIRKDKHSIMKTNLLETNDGNRNPNYNPLILYINHINSDTRNIISLNLIIEKDIDYKKWNLLIVNGLFW